MPTDPHTPAVTPLFCLRAAASRAKRKARRTAARFYRYQNGMSHSVREAADTTVLALCRRAEVLAHRYFDACYEAKRAAQPVAA